MTIILTQKYMYSTCINFVFLKGSIKLHIPLEKNHATFLKRVLKRTQGHNRGTKKKIISSLSNGISDYSGINDP